MLEILKDTFFLLNPDSTSKQKFYYPATAIYIYQSSTVPLLLNAITLTPCLGGL